MRIPTPAGLRPRSAAAAAYASAKLPGRRLPWRAASWCALDLELTGLDRRTDEIISFGVIPIDDGRLRLRDAVHQLVRPAAALGEDSIRIHGIRPLDLARAPVLDQALDSLLEAITGRVLVVHTAAVERPFLTRALRQHGVRLRGPLADTELLGRLWLHDREGSLRRRVGLTDLASQLGLPAERPHDALGDALTTAQAFIALAAHLDAERRETVGSLTRASVRVESLRILHSG